jgi:hypothetical protein
MTWFDKFKADGSVLRAFVGKSIPDIPGPVVISEWDEEPVDMFPGQRLKLTEPSNREMTQRQLVLEWQDTALKMARECGRVRKSNAFAFTMSNSKSSVTVPEATYNLFVDAGIIDKQGNVL